MVRTSIDGLHVCDISVHISCKVSQLREHLNGKDEYMMVCMSMITACV